MTTTAGPARERAESALRQHGFDYLAEQFWNAIERAQSIVITTHLNPDGDALGSLLGLFHTLSAFGKDPMMFCADPAPPHLEFLSGHELIFVNSSEFPWNDRPIDLLIILDCSAPERLGASQFLLGHARETFVIDHHADPDTFEGLHIVDEKASSTGEILLRIIQRNGAKLTREAALAFYIAIITDTGSFRYGNTSAASFRAASDLVEAGTIDVRSIGIRIFARESLARLRLRGQVYERSRIRERVIYSQITPEMFRESGANSTEAEAIVDDLALCREADIAAVFWEGTDGSVRVQLRSVDSTSVLGVAQALGGGGHDKAAGVRIPHITLEAAQEKVFQVIRTPRRS